MITITNLYLVFPFASRALNPKDQLLGGLGLLSQDRFRLTAETLLLTVISSSTLGLLRLGRLLILSHLELIVLVAPRTVGVAGLGYVNHCLAELGLL